MDLYDEENNNSKVLAARHIGAEKSLFDIENALNSSRKLLCHSHSLQPSFETYYEALDGYAWLLWTGSAVALFLVFLLFIVTLRSARRHWKHSLCSIGVVLAVYPLVSASAYIAILIPRARIVSEALAQQAVMVGMYHLYKIVVAECGGREQLIRSAVGSRLETRVLPCCCWPCCLIPRPQLQKQNLTWLRYFVLQMPIVQGLVYVVVLVLWAEDMGLYIRSFVFIQPFIVVSILIGVWGMIMCVRAAEATGAKPRYRFLALQLVLLVVKLQCGAVKVLPEMITLPCLLNMHPVVFVNMLQNTLMILEMLVLSVWAWRLYRVPPASAHNQNVAVAVLEDSTRSINGKPKDGVENKSFEDRV